MADNGDPWLPCHFYALWIFPVDCFKIVLSWLIWPNYVEQAVMQYLQAGTVARVMYDMSWQTNAASTAAAGCIYNR